MSVSNVVQRFQEFMRTLTEWLSSTNIDCEFDELFIERTQLLIGIYDGARLSKLEAMLIQRIQYDFLRGSESGDPQITDYMQILSKKSNLNPRSKIRITEAIYDLEEIRTLNVELRPEIYRNQNVAHISSLFYPSSAAQ